MKKSKVSFFIGIFLTSSLFVSCSGNSENSLENELNKKEDSKVKVSK